MIFSWKNLTFTGSGSRSTSLKILPTCRSVLERPQREMSASWRGTRPVLCLTRINITIRVVFDSWVVSQDSNESSQIWVGSKHPGYDSSLSRITLIVIWVRVESTWYRLSQKWVHVFSEEKTVRILDLSIALQGKNHPTFRPYTPPPKPGQQLLVKLIKMWCVVSQVLLNPDSNELSRSWVDQVSKFEI